MKKRNSTHDIPNKRIKYTRHDSLDRVIYYKDMALKLVKKNGLLLQYACNALKDNEQVVEEAVTQNGLALQYASSRLRDNEDIVRSATVENPKSFQYASERLMSDAHEIEYLFSNYLCDTDVLYYVSKSLLDSAHFWALVVNAKEEARNYAPEKILNSKEFAILLVQEERENLGNLK
jgi:hypothetical protein